MKLNNKILLGIFSLVIIILFSNFFSAYMTSNVQAFQFTSIPTSNFTKEICQEGQDFIIQITPFGCTPAVVRSDLLEESDVPVYCQLGATKINPLIEVQAIDSISFSGSYSPQVSSLGFYPAKAALGVEGQLNTPILSNIGYVVIILKKQANASAIPDYITGNLTAKIKYNINNAFGIGKALFYLPEISSDEDFQNQKDRYSFWSGRGYLRADNIESDSAEISLYSNTKISTVNLKEGETSQSIYLPGFECQAGLKLKLENLDNADTRAKLRVNAEVVEVARGEKFLNNKCQVRNLQANGLVQRVGLRCQEDTGTNNFDLTISPRLVLNVNGEDKEVSLGQKLYQSGDRGIYLGYIGAEQDSKKAKDLFVYLVSMPQKKENLTEEELSSISSLVGDLIGAGQKSTGIIDKVTEALNAFAGVSISLGKAIGRGEIFYRINYNDKNQDFYGGKVSIINFAGAQDKEFLDDNLKEQYENAKADYETLRKEFSSEVYKQGTTTFGEEALYKEIILAWEAEQKKTVSDLCNEFSQAYPDSTKIIKECSDSSKLSSQEVGEVYLTINKQIKKISFDGIYEPSFEDYGARVMVSAPSKSGNFDLRKSKLISSTGFSLQLVSLSEDSARIQISVKTDKETKIEIVNLIKGVTNDFESGYSFTLTKINLKKVAKVSLVPNIDNSGTQANFNFKIGIEKRAINLAPEQIKQIINQLNGWISTWSNISSVLGKGVEGLKTACIVTGATLITKSFIENSQGAGIARQSVMRGTNGWFEKCAEMVSAKTYVSQEKCFLENADKIDKDVAEMTKILNEQDSNFKKLQEGITRKQFLSEDIVNTSALMKQYSEQQISYLKENLPESALSDPTGVGEKIDKNNILDILSYDNWNKGQYSLEQLKEIELYTKVLKDTSASPELQEAARARLYSVLLDIDTTARSYTGSISWVNSLSNVVVDDINYVPINEKVKTMKYTGKTLGSIGKGIEGFNENTPVALVQTSDNKKYLVILDNSAGTNILPIKAVTDADKGYIKVDNIPEELKNVVFQKYDASSYNNAYQNAQVKYYETDPYKGMPAIVPFDLKNGWYAATKPTIPSGSNLASYEASGRVSSFWVCNVGKNGLEEFQTTGDDTCEMINTGTGQAYNQFPGLSETEAKSVIKKAQGAIEQASKVSESQRKGYITIAGQRIQVGSPALDIPQFECQDFMSPKDCLLLFNLCDPVICPSSRCDLGGAYPVRDVVQSGIIGSIALCLPNAQEGIVMPVCLTGIKAGIDSFLSVLTATKDCLQESLDTGKNVGVCDEIFSVYMCDFFWKQALPFADMIIPKIISTLSGQNTRGGGEYLGVASAWSTAEKSVNYFTNYYAANAKQAFIARTTEGIQGEFCKLFISGVVPSGGDILNTLTKPDSPSQFTGRFEEIPFTTVTVPPTSQYKVFYHIFAGKDSGAYYQVYLKGSSSSSYYQDTSSNYNVASGYIAVGGYASETKDFIAASGYKELCITVNGQEECGFKEVSTSFALNYIKDEYLKSQATETDIKTEAACISGTASVYSLLSGNVQSAAQEMINPAIYNQGITRVCATANPGQGTDANAGTENSRWVDVGYCDNTKIRCWLDTETVKDVIKTTTVEAATLKEATESYLRILRNEGGYLSEENFSSTFKEIEKEIDNSKKITMINNIFNKIFWSSEKALLLNLRGDTYAQIFRDLLKVKAKPTPAPEPEVIEVPTIPKEEEIKITEKPVIPPTEELVLGDISGLSEIRQKVLTKADSLIKTCSSTAINCWDAVYTKVYASVGVGTSCIYSDKAGKKYTINNEKTNGETKTITIGVDKKDGDIIFKSYSCTKSSADTSTSQKLDLIQPGDLLSIVWNQDWGHNVIFVKWIDKSKGLAQVFDWNGVTESGNKFSNGKPCDSSCYSSKGTFCKSFRYYETDLSDTGHPAYVIMQPAGDASKKPVCDTETCSAMLPDVDDESPISTAFIGTTTKTTLRDEIWQTAGNIALGGSSDNAAKFVSTTLIAAGVKEDSIEEIITYAAPSVSNFISVLSKSNKFLEINVDGNLKKGDILLIGKGCDIFYSTAIFSTFSTDNKKISFYTNLKDKVNLETKTFISGIDNNEYFHKAYRYVGDLSSEEKKSIASVRRKWNLNTALNKVDELLKLPNRNKGGTYIDNKIFVDQLIFDGLLIEKECGDVRTWGFLGAGQKRMDWLKNLLLVKCGQDEKCRESLTK